MSDHLPALEARLDYRFRHPELLQAALTHPSYRAEHDEVAADNQRLEFLGDAVVQLILTKRLFAAHPEWSEGELTKLRATLTRRETLAAFARELQLGDCLRLSRGEQRSAGSHRTSTLGDAFEALVGAMYLDADHDLTPATALINRLVETLCPDAEEKLATDNPKGILQEWAQREWHEKPVYELLDSSGPDHGKTFRVAVHLLHECYGVGVANRLRTAEQEAARQALARLRQTLPPGASQP